MKRVHVNIWIFHIPYTCIEKYSRLDLSLPKFDYDHVRYFNKTVFLRSEGFLPRNGNNSNYVGPYYDGIERDVNRQCWDHHASYVHLKYMYVTYTATFVLKNMTLIMLEKYYRNLGWIRSTNNGPVIAEYPNVIATGHYQIKVFGHMIADAIIPLLMFPQEIIDKSIIVLASHGKRFEYFFNVIGIPLERVIFLNDRQWIFAQNLYALVDPITHLQHYGILSLKFSQKLRHYYGVENVIPTKYLICVRRKSNYHRSISNIQEVVDHMGKVYPERNFEIFEDPYDMNESAKIWSSAKFVFGPTGSNMYKHYFLKEKSIIIVALANYLDNSIAIAAGAHDVFSLFFRLEGLVHLGSSSPPLNIKLAERLFSIGLYCVDHQHYNPSDTFE